MCAEYLPCIFCSEKVGGASREKVWEWRDVLGWAKVSMWMPLLCRKSSASWVGAVGRALQMSSHGSPNRCNH
jgi:hypothetical protein